MIDAQIKDGYWDQVLECINRLDDVIPEKAGDLGALHARMYDGAQTERECQAIRDEAMVEVQRISDLPKDPTLEEQVADILKENAVMRKEIDELKKGSTP